MSEIPTFLLHGGCFQEIRRLRTLHAAATERIAALEAENARLRHELGDAVNE